MKRSILAIPIFALLLLGAHALRQGDFGLTAAFALMIGLIFTRQAWVRLILIATLLWGGCIWADTTVEFIRFRQALDMPWKRLAYIMGGLIVFDALAIWALLGQTCREFFDRNEIQATTRAVMFILVVFGLTVARSKVSFPILLADRYFPGWGWLEIMLLGFYAQWIGGKMLPPKGHRVCRPRLWAMFSAVFFGQLALGLMGMNEMLMTGNLHLPVPALIAAGPVFRGEGFFMIILFSVTLLLVGPAWCSHLCYIGAWDDVMSRLGPRPAHNALLSRLSVASRMITLILCIGAALQMRSMGIPGVTAVSYAAVFGLIGVGIMVFISRKAGMMTHCTAFCPMGLVANVFGKISPWRIRVGSDCTKCGACFTRCRYNALDESRVKLGKPAISCTMCGDCVSACVHKQISYRLPGLSAENARTLFIVIVVSLHAIFLGVARI
ncbi:4Fe-4S binding protein [Pseudodesulfovibrio sp. zrk46]|uniref:4Fe-4S binding protein n=1 Tax=Pseudodesulfovibrio sp. zrk46 TaxID=2725288 RepID=UPI001449F6CB|nr:4Fe-4S binding protein [Pseudodesulfovibrio sp. zrk46]QJB57802.1 4Fe-4S binding protein [Pseudodesulfovibrio sp. zrk46]